MKNKMWGGRFSKKTNPLVEEFTRSIHFDYKLAIYDVSGSLIHIEVLKKAKILKNSEYSKLKKTLNSILLSIKKETFKIDESFEDIHSYIQHLLEKKIGKVALKLHTARSRNDQVLFDVKEYSTGNLTFTIGLLRKLHKALAVLSKKYESFCMPGYTHMQHAIPVSLGDYFSAYSKMIERDSVRLFNVGDDIALTMGSGAVAGTFINASCYNIKDKILPTNNSIDTVSDRDFVIEILSDLSIIAMHLSRLSEDLILWSTKEFDFIDIDETFCTGSSLMPQKKNPDCLELIRGNTGRIYGNLMNVLTMMKGLPLSYNRDMQLDKEPLFDSFKIIQNEVKILTELLPKISFKKENIEKELEDECLYATDLADFLVKNNVAFKEAHSIIGQLISHKLKTKKEIKNMADSELNKFHPKLNKKIVNKIIDPKTSVSSKKSIKRK